MKEKQKKKRIFFLNVFAEFMLLEKPFHKTYEVWIQDKKTFPNKIWQNKNW